jgi:hypothetical protein
MANAQVPSNSTSGTNSTSNETGVKQMGICQVGAGGPFKIKKLLIISKHSRYAFVS